MEFQPSKGEAMGQKGLGKKMREQQSHSELSISEKKMAVCGVVRGDKGSQERQ